VSLLKFGVSDLFASSRSARPSFGTGEVLATRRVEKIRAKEASGMLKSIVARGLKFGFVTVDQG